MITNTLTKQELSEFELFLQNQPDELDFLRAKTKEENLIIIKGIYQLTALGLNSYFTGEENPYEQFKIHLPDDVLQGIKKRISSFMLWSIILFEAGHYLKKEAENQGFDYPGRLEALKLIVKEECRQKIWELEQIHYESLTGRQLYNLQIAFESDFSKDIKFKINDNCPTDLYWFTTFCIDVIHKNRHQCPTYTAWIEAANIKPNRKKINESKLQIINQEMLTPTKKGNRKPNPRKTLKEKLGYSS